MSVHAYSNSYETYDDLYNEDSRSQQFEQNTYDSEEDTDDASETEYRNHNRNNHATNNTNGATNHNHELKEQMYQLKLASLNKQLEELKQFTHPEYLKRLKKLEYQYKQRLHLNDVYREYLKKTVEQDFNSEMKAALKEYEEKKIDLKDNILTDLEERKKQIETERYSLELTTDSMEIKPTVTRKLRRRPNDPVPVVEKRRKPTTGQLLVYLLDEKDIEVDLKTIQRALQQNGINSYGGGGSNHQQSNSLLSENVHSYVDARIEDNKLWYERRWFCRGQPVYVDGKDISKFAATITAIGNEAVWVKKANDTKVKINMSHLNKGKVSIKRRAN